MSLCTGCPHLPHPGRCVSCECSIVTLNTGCACDGLGEQITHLTRLVELLAARTEYLIAEALPAHEAMRRVPILEARVAALEARAHGWDNGADENGG